VASVYIDKLKRLSEMNPDSHDGSYELVRETVQSLSTLNESQIGIEDLDMLYLMTVITQKSSIANKNSKVDESHLSKDEKARLKNVLSNVQNKADSGAYENTNKFKLIGMFGTGFLTFKTKIDVTGARKIIKLCIDISRLTDEDKIFDYIEKVFVKDIKGIKAPSLSQILHCLKPDVFPILNRGENAGFKAYQTMGVALRDTTSLTTLAYNLRKIKEFRDINFIFKNYRVIDFFMYNNSGLEQTERKYWVIAPGHNAQYWDEFVEAGIMALGSCEIGDLRQYGTKQKITEALKKKSNDSDVTPFNDALGLYNIAFEMNIGDILYARKGSSTLLGIGTIESDYIYDNSREKYKHVRKVKWTKTGEWSFSGTLPQKALTEYTEGDDIISRIKEAIKSFDTPFSGNYWRVNAKPGVWSFSEIKIGETVEFTSHTDQGTERKIYKCFEEAQEGDYVIGYETAPTKAIVALCKVVREHNGEDIILEKVRDFKEPLTYEKITEIHELSSFAQQLKQYGTLFRLSKDEFDIIMELLSDTKPEVDTAEPYGEKEFLKDVFLEKKKYLDILSTLEYKKNIILQGPPGVGKTFVAKKFAWARMKKKDNNRIQMVQFHQSYSYEDFIKGYRPTEDGGFKLKSGVFYDFCVRAQRDKENEYFFIIDEINRGNLSKIFGEIMMLIECDKRGADFEIPLTYSESGDDKFYIPENLYIIGTMNTADRSLAMVDYALRRRFSFIDVEPAFETDAFAEHLDSVGISENIADLIIENMINLNEIIENDSNLGKGFRIGHSYFCSKPKASESSEIWYDRVIEFEIKPLLFEYWFDQEDIAAREYETLKRV